MYTHTIDVDDSVNQGWMYHSSLEASCLASYSKDIEELLQSEYTTRMRNTQPLVDNIFEVDHSNANLCVPVEFFALQKDSLAAEAQGPTYSKRDIIHLEDIIADVIEPGVPLSAQEYRLNNLITVSGAGGQGKTTQLFNIATDWCNKRSHILGHYSHVFYIPLHRHLKCSNLNTIADVICEGTGLLPMEQKNKLNYLFTAKSNGEKFLFLFDDYKGAFQNCDQINAILNGYDFPNSTVLVCGRPYWMKNFKSKRDPDAIVDIIGLTDESVENLFNHLLNEDNDLVQSLMDICKQYVFDITLLKIPLFATMCCYVFQANHAQNLDVCQHTRPTTTTELFNTILRLFLMMLAKNTGRNFAVNFNNSPLTDIETDIPADIKRLLYQLSKMSFHGIKSHQEHFTERDLKEFMIDPYEVSNLGILVCISTSELIPGSVYRSSLFAFRHKMFQEYMAGLYLAKENYAWEEITRSFLFQSVEASDEISEGDDGYHSLEGLGALRERKPKYKRRFKSLLQYLVHSKSKSSNLSNKDTEDTCLKGQYSSMSSETLCKAKVPTEHYCPEFEHQNSENAHETHLKGFESIDCVYRRQHSGIGQNSLTLGQSSPCLINSNSSSATQNHSGHQVPVTTKKYLYNLLAPFQNTVMFACGVSSHFAKQVLLDCKDFVTRKVCKWNNNKFDVGYEAVLYCETQDSTLIGDFYKFLIEIEEKTPSVVQFPRPYDEVATVRLASDLANSHAELLLSKWYNLDLNDEYLHGANIVNSDTSFIEMNDPCLFEVLLMHKFKHFRITKIKAVGNYFLGFQRLSNSFPALNELVYEGVNIPSLPKTEIEETPVKDVVFLSQLKHLQLLNVRASYPLCPELQILFQSCSLESLCLERVQCSYQELFSHISLMHQLERLMISKMAFTFEDLVSNGARKLQGQQTELKLSDVLEHMRNITSLDLTDNTIGIALTGLLYVLQKQSIMELVFKKCRVPTNTFVHCSPLFEKFQNLCHLDIGSNPVQESLGSIVHWLGKCPTLQAFGLRKCNLSPAHFKEAARGLCKLKNLTRLDISENSLASAAGEVFENLPVSIQELFVGNCLLQAMDVVSGANALKRLVNLKRLDIHDNPIHAGSETVVRALKKSRHIEVLHMQNCKIMPKQFQAILHLLPSLPYLREIGIGKNTCWNQSYDARDDIVNFLCLCKKLEKVLCCVLYEKSLKKKQIDQLRKKVKEVVIFRFEV